MGYLSSEDQQLIFDFYFRCGNEDDIARGRDLIAANPEASRLYAGLEDTLTELDSLKYVPCPDNLADLTVARLKMAAAPKAPGSSKLEALLQEEQENQEYAPAGAPELTGAGRFWRPVFEILATAAAILLVAGIVFPTLGAIREHSRQFACANNLRQFGRALAAFSNDHNGQIATVRVPVGSPWWKIGCQEPDVQSNTRYVFQLVKGGYVDASAFLCNGHQDAHPKQYSETELAELHDFPSRYQVSYSFMLLSDENNNLQQRPRRIIAADLNPLFQRVSYQPTVYRKQNEFERIELSQQLREMMSPNHRNRGQNALYSDGSVTFIMTRIHNQYDIYTIQDVDVYTGREAPIVTEDIFLAP